MTGRQSMTETEKREMKILKRNVREVLLLHIVPKVKFLDTDSNCHKGYNSFDMPDFTTSISNTAKVPHIIMRKLGMRDNVDELGQKWVEIRSMVKPIIDNHRSNASNVMKKQIMEGKSCVNR